MAKLSLGSALFESSGGNLIDSPPGGILQIQHAYVTSATQVTASSSMAELDTDLRIAFTPRSATSFLYFEFDCWFCTPNSTNLMFAKFYDITNSEMPAQPPANGSRDRVHWAKRTSQYDNNDFDTCNMRAVVQNTNTTARTYTIYWRTEGVTNQFLSSTLSSTAGVTAPMMFKITEVAT